MIAETLSHLSHFTCIGGVLRKYFCSWKSFVIQVPLKSQRIVFVLLVITNRWVGGYFLVTICGWIGLLNFQVLEKEGNNTVEKY